MWLTSPVCRIKSACCFDCETLILSMAAFSVAVTSVLAGLLKPMWLSLIWKKLNEPASAGLCVPAKRRDVGTPPMKVHSSPVPAHAIQVRKSRRSISSAPFTTSMPVKIFLSATMSVYRADRGSTMPLSFARDFHFEVPRCLSEESPAPHSRKDHVTKSVQNQTLIN